MRPLKSQCFEFSVTLFSVPFENGHWRQNVRRYCESLKLWEKLVLIHSAQGERPAIKVTLVWFFQEQLFEKTRPRASCRAVPFSAPLNCGEALDATAEFITLNERLCSRPHSITHEPDDKLRRLP